MAKILLLSIFVLATSASFVLGADPPQGPSLAGLANAGNLLKTIGQLPNLPEVGSKLKDLAQNEDQKGLLQILETLSKVALLSQANKSKLVANKAKAEEPFKQAKEGTTLPPEDGQTTDNGDDPEYEEEDDLVPIILGSVLAGLVLLVLAGYLVHRFWSC